MGEFDWWSLSKLRKLANAVADSDEPSPEGQQFGAPPVADGAFWRRVAEECEMKLEAEDSDDDEPHEALARDVHAELAASDAFVQVTPSVMAGDLGAAESRLLLALRGVTSIVYAASHEMDSLWREDGIAYHTLKVSPATEPHKTLLSQLSQTVAFMRAHSPALVCSSCPKLRAVAVAAFLHGEGAAGEVDVTLERLRATGLLVEPLGDTELNALRDYVATLPPADSTPRVRPEGSAFKAPNPPSPCKRTASIEGDVIDAKKARPNLRIFKREVRMSEEAL